MKILSFLLVVFISLPFSVTATEPPVLTVSVASATRTSIPRGANRVFMQSITLTAGCTEDVSLESAIIHHDGLGDPNDIVRVYLLRNNRRLTRARSLTGNEHSAKLDLRNVTIKKCTSDTLHIYADFAQSASAGGEHRIGIQSKEDVIIAEGTVEFKLLTQQAGLRTVPGSTGTLELEYLPVTGRVTYGNNRTISRFTLSADGEADQIVSAITFTNEGSARNTDLQNLSILHSNKGNASNVVRSLDGETVRFTFDPPLLIEQNQTRQFTIQADVRASKRRTIRLEIEETSDIESVARKQRGGSYQ